VTISFSRRTLLHGVGRSVGRSDAWLVRCGLDYSGSRYGPVVGFCEHSNEPSGSIKGAEFLG
jgi:hypothetical protein